MCVEVVECFGDACQSVGHFVGAQIELHDGLVEGQAIDELRQQRGDLNHAINVEFRLQRVPLCLTEVERKRIKRSDNIWMGYPAYELVLAALEVQALGYQGGHVRRGQVFV